MSDVMSLSDMKGVTFKIPHYQRGYRWGEKEVLLLLDDLDEFMGLENSGDSYCLQPLVLKQLEENTYRVVDGQQRLTTIWLLMHAMGQEPGWTIRYEYLPEEPEITIPVEDDANAEDINRAFRWEAYDTMGTWRRNRDSEHIKKMLDGTGTKRIVFIKYFVQEEEDEHDVFDRLNNGKIPLTSAELIRALFMSSSLPENSKMEIAKEWEMIEDALRAPGRLQAPERLRAPEMWEIFTPPRDKNTYPVRLDLLFKALSNVSESEIKRDGLAVYHEMEESFKKAKKEGKENEWIEGKWKDVLECFWWMCDCRDNPVLHNYLGWLALVAAHSLKKVHSWWKKDCNCDKGKFESKLRQEIAKCLGGSEDDIALPTFAEWRYKCDNLKEFLLLLNILECNGRNPPAHFRFDAYTAEKGWDIEHIHSQTYQPFSDLTHAEKEELLNSAIEELDEKQNTEIGKRQSFEEKIAYLNDVFAEEESDFDLHSPGNLALLDLSTNRAYKNAWFPIKRKWIVQEIKNGRFIPPCTFNAFMKVYNPKPVSLVKWTDADSKAYGSAMKTLYDNFGKALLNGEKS